MVIVFRCLEISDIWLFCFGLTQYKDRLLHYSVFKGLALPLGLDWCISAIMRPCAKCLAPVQASSFGFVLDQKSEINPTIQARKLKPKPVILKTHLRELQLNVGLFHSTLRGGLRGKGLKLQRSWPKKLVF